AKPETATITFAAADALPADLANSATAAKRHLRVRKWDSDLTAVPPGGGTVPLECGIEVTFSFAPTGAPHVGDYWVFAARSAAPTPEESLETLIAAPPRGIHHHYARLATVTLPSTVTDCRHGWPHPDGGDSCVCQICVTPEHDDGDEELTLQGAAEK